MTAPVTHASPEDSAYRAIFEASSDGLVINDPETGAVLAANPAFCQMHGYADMVGVHPSTFIHPNSHHLFAQYLQAVREGRDFRTRAQDVRRDGSVFDIEVFGRGFIYDGRPALLGVVRDVTEHVRAYQDLEELVGARTREIERRREVAEALSELLAVVNSRRDLNEMLDAILGQAARLLGSDAEGVYLFDRSDSTVLRLQASRNLPPAGELVKIDLGAPVVGLAAQRLKPVAIFDIADVLHAPIAVSIDEQVCDRGAYFELTHRDAAMAANADLQRRNSIMAAEFRTLLGVPLLAREHCHGSLLLAYRTRHEPSDEELDLMRAFATQAGLAIETAGLQEEAERRQRESERRRRELEGLYQADQALHRSLKLEQVLDALIDLPVALGQAEIVSLLMWDEQQGLFVVGGGRGLSEGMRRETFTRAEVRIAREEPGDAIVEVDDAATDPRISERMRATVEREGVRAWISSPIRIAGELFGSLSFGFAQPHRFVDRERRLLVALAQRAALAIQNARLHEESELRRQELQALYEADAAMHRSLRLQDVLEALVDAAMNLLRADSAGVWGLDSQAEHSQPLAWRGLTNEYVEATIRMNQDPAVLEYWWGRETFAIEDVSRDPTLPPVQRTALEQEGCRSMLSTRIDLDGKPFGSFTVGHHVPHSFTDQEQRLLTALAQRAGLAIQNARLYEQAQQVATVEERQRLARELHDAVTQTLFSTALIAEVLPELWELNLDEGRERLTELRRLTRGALAEMRSLLVELRPGALNELPLGDLLRQLAEATAGRLRLDVSTHVGGRVRPLPANVHVVLYRLTQEALNNVVKHARAQHALVALLYESDCVRLRIEDDGCGFDQAQWSPAAGHFGLGIMQERAASVGAVLEITSQPDAGTRVDVAWRESEDSDA